MGPRLARLAAAALVALPGCGHAEPVHSADGQQRARLAVWRVYMGVACGKPNWIGCDRVGLAIWLPVRPRGLDASIGGRSVAMRRQSTVDAADYGARKHRPLAYYVGFLQPAGLMDGPLRVQPDGGRRHWTGLHPVEAKVRLVAHYRNGEASRRTLSVGLAAGWG
jgi:hypothetical protein